MRSLRRLTSSILHTLHLPITVVIKCGITSDSDGASDLFMHVNWIGLVFPCHANPALIDLV